MSNVAPVNVPFNEMNATTTLVREHDREHAGRLKAVILFGDLVTTGNSYDINLLEVVESWEGIRYASFHSSPSLPLRGRLRIYFLTPEEFERPVASPLPGESWSSAQLLEEVRQAYTIMLERPAGYAYHVLRDMEGKLTVTLVDDDAGLDPLAFISGARQRRVIR